MRSADALVIALVLMLVSVALAIQAGLFPGP